MRTWILRCLAGLSLLGAALVVLFFALMPAHVDRTQNVRIPAPAYPVSDEAAALHRSIPVADLHADSLLWRRDLTRRHDRAHSDWPRMREGGQFLQLYTAVTKSPEGQNYDENASDAKDAITALAIVNRWPIKTWNSLEARAAHMADRLYELADRDGRVFVVRSASDLEAARAAWAAYRDAENEERAFAAMDAGALTVVDLEAHEARKAALSAAAPLAAILGIEGAHALGGDPAAIDRLYAQGFRVVGLQHFFDNDLGGSLHGVGKGGLTDFGREAVTKMRERGIIIDVAHSSEAVVREAVAMGAGPLLISHTGFQGHCPTARNISDETMAMIASNGGLIGVGFWAVAACGTAPEDVADAILYGVRTFGVDHIALGTDYDGTVAVQMDAAQLPMLTQALLNAGLSEEEVRKIMGENILRFFQDHLPA